MVAGFATVYILWGSTYLAIRIGVELADILLFAGANIRYATASYQGNWKYNINIRYAVVPAEGKPTLFETAGSDLQCAKIDLPWIGTDHIRPAITWKWAETAEQMMADKMVRSVKDVLTENGVEKEKIGIDNLDMPAFEAFKKLGMNIVNGWPAVSRARVIKTRDEIELLKMASSIGDGFTPAVQTSVSARNVSPSESTIRPSTQDSSRVSSRMSMLRRSSTCTVPCAQRRR